MKFVLNQIISNVIECILQTFTNYQIIVDINYQFHMLVFWIPSSWVVLGSFLQYALPGIFALALLFPLSPPPMHAFCSMLHLHDQAIKEFTEFTTAALQLKTPASWAHNCVTLSYRIMTDTEFCL